MLDWLSCYLADSTAALKASSSDCRTWLGTMDEFLAAQGSLEVEAGERPVEADALIWPWKEQTAQDQAK